MTAATQIEAYRSYRGLPTLAGLATIAAASRPGLSIEACVHRASRVNKLPVPLRRK